MGCAMIILLLVLGIFTSLFQQSQAAIKQFGRKFLIVDEWNPVLEEFGALSSVYGTMMTTAIAMVIAVPMSLAIALFLVELAPPKVAAVVGTAIELLAAVPSIIYGMWGFFVFVPWMSKVVQPALQKATGGEFWLFSGPTMGLGILTASIILALMVLPFMTSVTRDVLRMVPPIIRESAYGMGSTTWEVTRKVTVPYGLRGIVGAGFLALGRAMGETMAVTFVIGNFHQVRSSLFAPGNTISSTLANEFAEADNELHLSSLIGLALVLFMITVVVQFAAYAWLAWMRRGQKGARS